MCRLRGFKGHLFLHVGFLTSFCFYVVMFSISSLFMFDVFVLGLYDT